MPTTPSKYAENQFLAATEGHFDLMDEVLTDTLPKLTAAAATESSFGAPLAALTPVYTQWTTNETAMANAQASITSLTAAFRDKLDSLTRKPDLDTNSPLESWDATIRGQVAYGGTTYIYLLPQGRETVTSGSREQQLDALRDFAVRLGEQSTKPVLVTLGTTVNNFQTAARTLFTSRQTQRDLLESLQLAQEALRVEAANELIGMVGIGMNVWKDDLGRVDSLFDVDLLRQPPQSIPAAPADTTWTPALRRLSTTAMPAGATRLQAWRLGPGGAPELLATGDRGILEVTIPADITFDAGKTYGLWLQGLNGRGTSEPGPVQNWTAV